MELVEVPFSSKQGQFAAFLALYVFYLASLTKISGYKSKVNTVNDIYRMCKLIKSAHNYS